MEEKNYTEGLYFNDPHPNAPDFIIGSLSFKKHEFLSWLDQQEDQKGYVKVDIKRSQKGTVYCELNKWTPSK